MSYITSDKWNSGIFRVLLSVYSWGKAGHALGWFNQCWGCLSQVPFVEPVDPPPHHCECWLLLALSCPLLWRRIIFGQGDLTQEIPGRLHLLAPTPWLIDIWLNYWAVETREIWAGGHRKYQKDFVPFQRPSFTVSWMTHLGSFSCPPQRREV